MSNLQIEVHSLRSQFSVDQKTNIMLCHDLYPYKHSALNGMEVILRLSEEFSNFLSIGMIV